MSAGSGFMLSRIVSMYQNIENSSSAGKNLSIENNYTKGYKFYNPIRDKPLPPLSRTLASYQKTRGLAEEDPEDIIDAYEQNLYEIYIRYYSEQVSPQDWAKATGGKGDTYTIQTNDTLWDISKVLFNDPNYWPKLWSVNPSIGNPHLIRPGQSLGFIHGTAGQPPSMVILDPEAQEKTTSPDTIKAIDKFIKTSKIKMPAPKKTKPVLNQLPDSLPVLYIKPKEQTKQSIIDMDIEYKALEDLSQSSLTHYMSSQQFSDHGKITDKKEEGLKWSADGQRVILELKYSANPGEKWMVVQNLGRLRSWKSGVRGPFGYQIEIQGEVEILGRIKGFLNRYEAKVTETLNPVVTGAYVVNQPLPKFNTRDGSVSGPGDAQIIGFPPSANSRQSGALFSLVYLNRGADSGFSVGQMYQIQANPKVRDKFPYGYNIKLGELKVIHTTARFATGIITSMSNPVQLGDNIVPRENVLSKKEGSYDLLETENALIEDENDIIVEDSPSSTAQDPTAGEWDETYIDEEDAIEDADEIEDADADEIEAEDEEYIDEDDEIDEEYIDEEDIE